MSYQMIGLGEEPSALEKVAGQCVNLKSADISTKAAREKTFKDTAKCAAEAACAIYSKGTIPPGVCSSVAGPIADTAVQVWNSVYSIFSPDDAYERAVLAAQVQVPMAYVQLRRLSLWLQAHWHNVIAGLIQFNDHELPDRKGTLGSGGPKQSQLVLGESKYNKAEYFPYLYYSDNRGAAQALAAEGAPPGLCGAGTWCSPPDLLRVYSDWAQSHGSAGSIEQLQKINQVAKLQEAWMLALDTAALRVQAKIAAESTARRMMVTGMVKLLQLQPSGVANPYADPTHPVNPYAVQVMPSAQSDGKPMSPVAKTVVVAGAGGLLWWLGKRFLF